MKRPTGPSPGRVGMTSTDDPTLTDTTSSSPLTSCPLRGFVSMVINRPCPLRMSAAAMARLPSPRCVPVSTMRSLQQPHYCVPGAPPTEPSLPINDRGTLSHCAYAPLQPFVLEQFLYECHAATSVPVTAATHQDRCSMLRSVRS